MNITASKMEGTCAEDKVEKVDKCHIHHNYSGINKPGTDCPYCWQLHLSKNPIKKYLGEDGIVGRQIRLNQVKLKVAPGSDYAEVLFFGDLHYGHPQCNLIKAKGYLDHALANNIYVICMGDLLECGLTTSIGDSVYQQDLNPQEQMEEVVDLLRPLAEKGLILGIHAGNHENRITKATSIDVTKILAKMLGVKYLGYACWNMFWVGGQKYSMYSTHGSGGSRYKHTKLKTAMDLAQWIDADVIAMGHLHALGTETMIKQGVDFRNRQVKDSECQIVLTGSFMDWDKSYAQMMNMPITKLGAPQMKLWASHSTVEVTI